MSENNYSKDYTDLRLIHTSRYGNSRVFTANYNGKKVIVKALKKECADDAACRASLKQEFDTTSILDNKYIRRALDFVQIEGAHAAHYQRLAAVFLAQQPLQRVAGVHQSVRRPGLRQLHAAEAGPGILLEIQIIPLIII